MTDDTNNGGEAPSMRSVYVEAWRNNRRWRWQMILVAIGLLVVVGWIVWVF